MKNHHVRRGAVGLVASALALAGIASVPTAAHATIEYAEVDAGGYLSNSGPVACAISGWTDADAVELVDNGVPVTRSWSAAATGTNSGDAADVTDLAVSGQITASISPIGAGPATIKASLSASASAHPHIADSACFGRAEASPQVQAVFNLPHPMWATITGSGNGSGAIQALVGDMSGSVAAVVVGNRSEGSASILLPAGPTQVTVLAQVQVEAHDPVRTRSYAGSVAIELKPLGTASAVSGKSKGIVELGNRDCASGNVTLGLTKKAKKKAKQVLVEVNGAKVAKLKGKKLKPRALVVPAARAAAAEVSVEIRLKNGKKVTVTRSYLACA